jgi:hypothetical protein
MALANSVPQRTLMARLFYVWLALDECMVGAMWFVLWDRLWHLSKPAISFLNEYPHEAKPLLQARKFYFCISLQFFLWSGVTIVCAALFIRFAGTIFFCSLAGLVPAAIVFAFFCLHYCILVVRAAEREKKLDKAITRPRAKKLSFLNVSRKARRESTLMPQLVQRVKAVCDTCTPQIAHQQIPCIERGVSLAFLQQFCNEFNISEEFQTWEVCKLLNKPHTERHKCCYFSMLLSGRSLKGEPWIGKQTVFVSHTWYVNV